MKASPPDPEQTLLASNFTVAQYKVARDTGNQVLIAEAIGRRFAERYVQPASLHEAMSKVERRHQQQASKVSTDVSTPPPVQVVQ
jgi:hypothetical protein